MEFRKMVTITLYMRQQKRHWCIEQSFGFCGRGRGWDDLGEWHWNMYNIIYETSRQSRFDAQYWMIGAGALGWPRVMVRGGRREESSGWGKHVYLWRTHFDIWQNQYNIVKFKNKIKLKKKKKNDQKKLPFLDQNRIDHYGEWLFFPPSEAGSRRVLGSCCLGYNTSQSCQNNFEFSPNSSFFTLSRSPVLVNSMSLH